MCLRYDRVVDVIFYGNTVREYLIAFGISAAVIVLVALIRALTAKRFQRAGDTATDLDDFALDLARRTKLFLLILPAIHLGLRVLTVPVDLRHFVQQAATLSLIAQGALWCAAVVDFWLTRYRERRAQVQPEAVTTINAFRLAAVVAIWIVAFLAAIDNLGFDITALIAGLGIGGVAIALATQNILGDLFASLSIVLDKPFVVGDFIIVGETLGTVEHIGLKTTRIRSLWGEQVVVSNGDLLKSRIRNMKRMAERRVQFKVGVTYQTPAAALEQIPGMIRAIIEQQPQTRVDRIHFMAFADSWLEFEIVYWIPSPDYNVYADIQQAVNLGIVRAFEGAGVEFAYPTRTLYVNNAIGMGPQ